MASAVCVWLKNIWSHAGPEAAQHLAAIHPPTVEIEVAHGEVVLSAEVLLALLEKVGQQECLPLCCAAGKTILHSMRL